MKTRQQAVAYLQGQADAAAMLSRAERYLRKSEQSGREIGNLGPPSNAWDFLHWEDRWAARILREAANYVRHPRSPAAARYLKAAIESPVLCRPDYKARGELAELKPEHWRRGLKRDYRFGRRK